MAAVPREELGSILGRHCGRPRRWHACLLGIHHAHGCHLSVSTCNSLAQAWLWLRKWAQPAHAVAGNAMPLQPPTQSQPMMGRTPVSSLLEVPRGTVLQLPVAVTCSSMYPESAPFLPSLPSLSRSHLPNQLSLSPSCLKFCFLENLT